ncbi:MAG: DNA polymerase/3'-5' exonuclease PolX [Elusimicrobia bacterium]|nr:DNA polymerase/3'-5' exonuclease PolX [Elusimicrobiota bacterium]
MENSQIAAVFDEIATLLELAGENPFRIRAYRRASQMIAGLPKQLRDIPAEEHLDIPGIGKGIAANIAQLLAGGSCDDLDALRKRFPKGLLELILVPGLGPKRAKLLFDRLKIDSLDALRQATREGRLRELAGFGPKLEENILKGIEFAAESNKRMVYWDAKLIMDGLLLSMKDCPGVQQLEAAGSLRRGRETVGDLDLLCTARDGAKVIEFFTRLPQVSRIVGAGDTKATVRLAAGIQCDLRVVPPESFGAALQYFTGSKDHNVALRALAQGKGLTINEYGLFRKSDAKQSKPLAGKTEKELYERLGLPWIPPELRENRGEIEAAGAGTLPELVKLKDVRGDFHNHTSHTDGQNSVLEMAQAAEKRGWEWVAIGDHSRSLTVASGLSIDDLRKSFAELKRAQDKTPGIRLMRSMEVDVLKDGSMDYPDPVLKEIDVVIASVHSAFSQPEPEMTERIRRAASNPHVDMIGHLSGRLLGRRDGYRVGFEAVLEAARDNATAFEINGQPQRQDIPDVQARRVKELDVPLAVTTDAHAALQYDYMELAVTIARRAWLTRKDILNCLSHKDLLEWLARPRGRKGTR